MKICIRCKKEPIDPDRKSYCKTCRLEDERIRWASKPIEKRRGKWLKYRYGKTYEWYKQTLEQQNHQCAICLKDIDPDGDHGRVKACVDHNHKTNKVRGLLCNHCNRGLGLFEEDIEILQAAINYLETYK